jgi:hypothetical protein
MYIQRTNTIDINIITKHLYNFFVKYFDFVSVQSNYIVNTFIMVPPGGSYFTQMDLQYHIPNINKHSQESVQIFCGHLNYRPVLSVTCDNCQQHCGHVNYRPVLSVTCDICQQHCGHVNYRPVLSVTCDICQQH